MEKNEINNIRKKCYSILDKKEKDLVEVILISKDFVGLNENRIEFKFHKVEYLNI